MRVSTIRTLTLVAITLFCMDEVFRFVGSADSNRIWAVLVGFAAIGLYWYFGRLARDSGKGYGWLLIPPIIFTVIPVYLQLSSLSTESGLSWWSQLFVNFPWFLGFVVPVGILMWIYYALRRHTGKQAAS